MDKSIAKIYLNRMGVTHFNVYITHHAMNLKHFWQGIFFEDFKPNILTWNI